MEIIAACQEIFLIGKKIDRPVLGISISNVMCLGFYWNWISTNQIIELEKITSLAKHDPKIPTFGAHNAANYFQ